MSGQGQSRKRPTPSTSPLPQGDSSSPSVPTTEPPAAGFAAPRRAGSSPDDLSETQKKRRSMPDTSKASSNPILNSSGMDQSLAPAPQQVNMWQSGQAQAVTNVMTPESIYTTPFARGPGSWKDSPRSGQTPSSSQVMPLQSNLGNENLPDFQNVMFPSDDPFAYPPNQPISTFEDVGHYDIQLSRNENPKFYTNDMFSMNIVTDHLANPGFQQGRHFSAPNPNPNPNLERQSNMFQRPNLAGQMPGQGEMGSNVWQNFANGKTGFTPGTGLTSGVNLEELFGSTGWDGSWPIPLDQTTQFNR